MKCVVHLTAEAVCKCTSCGADICDACRVTVKNENYCKKCVAQKIEGTVKAERSPFLAALLSFTIGGAGQIYNGQVGKGILIFLTSILILPWIYGIFDAYATAKKINSGAIKARDNKGCLVALAWSTVLAFIMIPILGILAAIAIPNFMKTSGMDFRKACSVINIKTEETSPPAAKAKEPSKAENGLSMMMPMKKVNIYKVILKNGQSFEAEIEREGPDMYIFKDGNSTFEINKAEVSEMKKIE
jgi:TM2 domain-containing membrane protein YozV